MPDFFPVRQIDLSNIEVRDSFYDCKASPSLIAAFEDSASKVVCSENQILFNAGEPGSCVYLVLSGETGLLLPLTSMGGMGFLARSGSFLGLPAAFSDEGYSMTAVALKGAELAVMSREKFCALIASNPALSFDVLKILAAEARAARLAIVEVDGSRNPG